MPVIADERVEPEFGTGALKVTPGHDPIDFEIGRDHGLPELTVIGPDGRMNENAGELAGLTQAEADERVLAWLKEHDRLEKRETTGTRSARASAATRGSSRWSRCSGGGDGGAAQAGARGAAGAARPLPPRVAAPVRDPLARGDPGLEHLAPALVGSPAAALVLPGRPRHLRLAAARRLRRVRLAEIERDPDVLDTWFSSALWPYATLGWPEGTPELERYYPGDVISTAREIIRLWENRMIWTGLELIGEIPFTDVIIHSTILAPDGRRMSKSLGTGSTRST